jgi:hypothetical protein
MAPRSERVVLSRSSSLPGHSDSPNVHDRFLPVSSGLQAADRSWSVVKTYTPYDPAETPGSQVRPFYHFLRVPMALLRVPCRCVSPFASLQAAAFPLSVEGRRVACREQVCPATGLSRQLPSGVISRSCTIRVILRPADLASIPDRVGLCSSEPSRYCVGASSARVLPHEPALCLCPRKGNENNNDFHVANDRISYLVHAPTHLLEGRP